MQLIFTQDGGGERDTHTHTHTQQFIFVMNNSSNTMLIPKSSSVYQQRLA